ncbi:MAG: hypothetical protein KAV42_02095 [Candidatus Krumholzibacteria bacterium]|nr:hypothetical protein [Candidatus Krumholzibacteria bacterium]
MTNNYYRQPPATIGAEVARKVKSRIMMLVLFSTVTVAIAFGMSFYFGLISGGSAISQQFPELGAIAKKMTSILMMNTLVFVVIIIGSFYLLGKLITKRMFGAIGIIIGNMQALTDSGKISEMERIDPGPFKSLDSSYRALVDRLREMEDSDISKLQKIVDEASGTGPDASHLNIIRELIAEKKAKTGIRTAAGSAGSGKSSNDGDPVFMQPA